MKKQLAQLVTGLVLTQGLSMPAYADLFGIKLGGEKSPTSGSAGPDGASGESKELEKCDKPYGTLAVAEPQDFARQNLANVGLPSPSGLIRLIIQQSNCFVVVERGVAMQNIMQERQLADSGLLKGGSNMGKGQIATADYVMTPDAVFSSKDSGGVGGALGGFGLGGLALGLLAAGLKFKSAQTTMTLADARSSIQVAAASGSAKKTDWSIGGLGIGGGVVGALGAYENTPEGKVIAASYLDNWNEIVRTIRNNPQLVRQDINLKQASGQVSQAGEAFNSGDVILGKIGGVKIYATPSKSGKVIGTLPKGEEVIYTGQEKTGFLSVQGNAGEGWVEKILVKK
jgi:curli biogenesis system outer membrane secretion channel CsgG